MKAPRTALFTAVVAVFALPAPALAEYLVPPGNSAVNQYTESVPTAGGQRGVKEGGGNGGRTPAKVLGRANAQRLEQHGEEGREAAEVAAETAPTMTLPAEPEPTEDGGGGGAGGASGGSNGGGGINGLGEKAASDGRTRQGASATSTAVKLEGSSGFGEVLAQATGSSSSGQLGLLLPLILLGVAAWALAFLLRERRRPTP